jgi:RNA polymerase sigma factor (sigma-70 family)
LADAIALAPADTRAMTDLSGDGGGQNDRRVDHAELVLAAKQEPGRREELIDTFLPLIGAVARPYARHSAIDRDDLMQQGVVGLLKALERYDPTLGAPFWAYASWWVRQAMQQLVSQLSGPVVLSDRACRQLARLHSARHAHLQQHRREPTRRELAAAADLDERCVASLMAARARPRSVEEPIGDPDGSSTIRDLLADPGAEDDFESVPRRSAAEALPALLAQLDDRERFIVCCRFGVDAEQRTLRAIAGDLGLSAERVRQIEGRALAALRAAASGDCRAAIPRI